MNSGYLNRSLLKTTGNYSLVTFAKLFQAVFKVSLKTLHADENTAPCTHEARTFPLERPAHPPAAAASTASLISLFRIYVQ